MTPNPSLKLTRYGSLARTLGRLDEYEALDVRARRATSLEESASVLADLLSGGYSVSDDGSLYSIKQLVANVRGLQIHVYAKESALKNPS